jgi:hypothetical protein
LKRVVKREPYLEVVDTEFKVSLKILSKEEVEEFMDRKDKRDLSFKYGIRGTVKTDRVVTCEDKGPYMLIYGDLKASGPPSTVPHLTSRNVRNFVILVKGC